MISEMFPLLDSEKISETLIASNMNVQEAINMLLGGSTESVVHGNEGNNEDSEEDQLLWDTPLSAAFFQNHNNASQSLLRFVSTAVNKFGQDLDIYLDRNKDILQQAMRKYKNPSFDITRPLNVSFIDEPGLDAGGVTREYFYLLMQRLQKSIGSLDLFEGQSGHLVPIHNYDVLSGGLFVLVGKMILHSVINSCAGMPGLSPAVVAYLISGSRDACVEHITLDDFPDPVFQDKLNQLVQCTEEKLCEFTSPDSPLDISELLMPAGFPHINITTQTRHLAYECCLMYEVITKRVAALNDIRKGLQSVKVMGNTAIDMLAKWPELKERFFPAAKLENVTATALASHLVYEVDDDVTLNHDTQIFFEKYVDELSVRDGSSSQEKLSDLLLFWTGYPALPINISTKLFVRFLEADPSKVLPEANTCPMVLSLPTIHKSYNEFQTSMDKAIAYGKCGFGKL